MGDTDAAVETNVGTGWEGLVVSCVESQLGVNVVVVVVGLRHSPMMCGTVLNMKLLRPRGLRACVRGWSIIVWQKPLVRASSA